MLYRNRVRISQLPNPTVVFRCKNFRRWPVSIFWNRLLQGFLRWALSDIGFVEGPVMETNTDKRVNQELIKTLSVMQLLEVKNFDLHVVEKKKDIGDRKIENDASQKRRHPSQLAQVLCPDIMNHSWRSNGAMLGKTQKRWKNGDNRIWGENWH